MQRSCLTLRRHDLAPSLELGVPLLLRCPSPASQVSSLVKTYSEFISFPIEVWTSSNESAMKVDDKATASVRADWAARRDAAASKGEAFGEPEPEEVMVSDFQTKWDWKVQNQAKPIWMRSPKEVEAADYNEFFKTTFKEFLDPLAHAHFTIEGDIEFRSILFSWARTRRHRPRVLPGRRVWEGSSWRDLPYLDYRFPC